MANGLTSRQAECLSVIRDSIAKKGYPPTLREIGDAMGIRSTNGIAEHLSALERKGHIVRADMKSRGVVLVETVPAGTMTTLDAVGWCSWESRMPQTGALIVVRGYFESTGSTPSLPGMVRRGRYLYVLANAFEEVIAMLKGFGFQEWTLGPV
jgi:SOS-response transcriptional repressor LexA